MAKTWLPHLKITLGGVLGSPAVEIWSCGLRYYPASPSTPPTPNQLQGVADAVAPDASAWMSAPEGAISKSAYLTYVKAVWVLNTGKQRDANTAMHDFASPVQGGGNNAAAIWEQSYALTFRTAVNRGRGHSGRIYPPISGTGPAVGQPYCAAGDANVMASNGALLLTNAATHVAGVIEPSGPTGGFAVMSVGDTVGGITPLATYITAVVCDRVADIQHRRVNRVPRLEGTTTTIPYIP